MTFRHLPQRSCRCTLSTVVTQSLSCLPSFYWGNKVLKAENIEIDLYLLNYFTKEVSNV